MDKEKKYWEEQINIYNSLPFEDNKKYYSWQPARWAGNYSAIEIMYDELKNIKSSIEVGAGSAAFSIALYNKYKKIEITAVDNSHTAVEYGKTISKDLSIPLNYIEEDLFAHNGKYDLVLSLGVIEHYTKNKMNDFIKKCIDLSNKYIMIAIPNQNSIFFKNYVLWSQLKSKKYMEKHHKFDNKDLKKLLRDNSLKIIIEDGFQLFLSEKDFLTEDTKNNTEMIKILKQKLCEYDKELSIQFPNVNFKMNDIENLAKVELSIDKNKRLRYSFMTFVLAEKMK